MNDNGSEGLQDKHESEGIERHIDKLENRRHAKEERRTAGALVGQRARGWTERLLTRTTSGAIYAVVVLACLCLGSVATTLMVSAMAWLCCSEFFRIVRMGGRMPNEVVGLGAAVLFPLAAYAYGLRGLVIILFLLLAACAVWYVLTPRANAADVAITVFGPLYTSLAFSSIVLIRLFDDGPAGAVLTLGVMVSISANDALAYVVGSRLGAHKLAPRISPHKSWEGFYGGLVASVVVWAAMSAYGVAPLGMPLALLGGLFVGIASVVGDLFESRLKRGVGVKDSGNLMPGHGGLLDRSDSMLFGGMAAYFILFFGGIL